MLAERIGIGRKKRRLLPSAFFPLAFKLMMTVHLLLTPSPKRCHVVSSSQASPRHTEWPAYRCFLPDLTGFTSFRCAGPNLQHHLHNNRPHNRGASSRD